MLPLPKFDALQLGAHRLSCLSDQALFESTSLRIAFFERNGGVSEGTFSSLNCGAFTTDEPQAVRENRLRIMHAVQSAQVQQVQQVYQVQASRQGQKAQHVQQVQLPQQTQVREQVQASKQPQPSQQAQQTQPSQQAQQSGDYAESAWDAKHPAQFIIPKQVHGTRGIFIAHSKELETYAHDALYDKIEADYVSIACSQLGALLNFADCLPLIIVAPNAAFSLVHAGWRGALAHIASKAALELCAQTNTSPAECNAYIGPHIRSECFQVNDEIAQSFVDEFDESVRIAKPADTLESFHIPTKDASSSSFVSCSVKNPYIDLASCVSKDLLAAGFVSERIVDAKLCTKCNTARYYSYRASGGNCGRHVACAIKLSER